MEDVNTQEMEPTEVRLQPLMNRRVESHDTKILRRLDETQPITETMAPDKGYGGAAIGQPGGQTQQRTHIVDDEMGQKGGN